MAANGGGKWKRIFGLLELTKPITLKHRLVSLIHDNKKTN